MPSILGELADRGKEGLEWLRHKALLACGPFLPRAYINGLRLMDAVLADMVDDKKVQRLIGKGADMSMTDKYGRTAFWFICFHGDENTVRIAVTELEKQGLHVDQPDARGVTPLMMVENDKPHIAQLLMDHGADPLRADHSGRSAMAWEDIWQKKTCVMQQHLADKRLKRINAVTENGATVKSGAAVFRKPITVKKRSRGPGIN